MFAALRSKKTPASLALSNFPSQWFIVAQGTGILSIMLRQLDYQFTGLQTISQIGWVLTIVLLITFLALYAFRTIVFPAEVSHALQTNANEVAALAGISITFTTIIQMIALNLPSEWGSAWGQVSYILWWINVVMVLFAAIGIPYAFVKYSHPGLGNLMSPAAQLPYISALTAAAGGGVICRYGMISTDLQVPVIIVSYLLIGLAMPLAFGQNQVFLTDLTRMKEPDMQKKIQVYQQMILCGPWGQCSFALQILGEVVMRGSFESYDKGTFLTAAAATPVGYASMFAGLLAWGQGTFFWAFAIISIMHGAMQSQDGDKGLRFGLPSWSIVFPWGVYANAAIQLGTMLDSTAFRVWSTVLTIMLVVIWLVNMALTIQGVFTGTILGLEKGWKVPKQDHDHSTQKGDLENGHTKIPNGKVVDGSEDSRDR